MRILIAIAIVDRLGRHKLLLSGLIGMAISLAAVGIAFRFIAGPGHGGPAIVGDVYLEGTWSEVYPNISQDEAGLKKLFTHFSA